MIFLSYAHVYPDCEVAIKIYQQLTSSGLKVWADWNHVSPEICFTNPQYRLIFIEAIRQSCLFISLQSKNSVHKFNHGGGFYEENKLAMEIQGSNSKSFILPVIIDDLRPDEMVPGYQEMSWINHNYLT